MEQDNRYQPPQSQVSDVPTVAEGELASAGARLGAAILDSLFSAVIIFPAMYFTGMWQDAMAGQTNFMATLGIGVLGLIVTLLLNGYLLHTSGQTIGKRLVGTRIVSFDDNRILPLWKVFALRYLPISVASQVPVVGSIAALVDALFVFRNDRRCIHDLIAGTKVINAGATWKGLDEEN